MRAFRSPLLRAALHVLARGPLSPAQVWNPKKYPREKYDLMPVLTPCYPCMNSTFNMAFTNLQVLKAEFKRGLAIASRVEDGDADWSELFEPHDFFGSYKNFVSIECWAVSEDEHRRWEGTVESKLRHLMKKLEVVAHIKGAHPYPKPIADPSSGGVGGLWISKFYLGLMIEPDSKINSRVVDLNFAAKEFTDILFEWSQYKQESMAVRLAHVRRSELPPHVRKPARRKRRRGADEPLETPKAKAPRIGATEAVAGGAAGRALAVKSTIEVRARMRARSLARAARVRARPAGATLLARLAQPPRAHLASRPSPASARRAPMCAGGRREK